MNRNGVRKKDLKFAELDGINVDFLKQEGERDRESY